jgi:hypothetical protein
MLAAMTLAVSASPDGQHSKREEHLYCCHNAPEAEARTATVTVASIFADDNPASFLISKETVTVTGIFVHSNGVNYAILNIVDLSVQQYLKGHN